MINFCIPGLYDNFTLNKIFIELMKDREEQYLNDDVNICAVYGCFPTSIWNGGRKENGFCSVETVKERIKYFNDLGIACRYTFTNAILNKEHLFDVFCNICMVEGNNGLNDVIIHSDILEEYIRKKYFSYGIISSTTKCLDSIEKLENECKKNYKLVVADYRLNRNPELFEIKEIGKLEVLVNAYCRDFCTERQEHYEALSRGQLAYSDKSSFHRCPYVLEDFETIKNSRKSFITIEEIRRVYHQKGIENYKIEGRTNFWADVLENYLYYLVKPQCKNEVRIKITKKMGGY